MSKPNFHDEYTYLQRQVIKRLAEIEQHDRDACANCGGEDCVCCEIYQDRQRWVSPAELFADDDTWNYPHRDDDWNGDYDENDEPVVDDDDIYDVDYRPDDDYSEDDYPVTRQKIEYPCDVPPFHCPFKTSEDDATSSYFCRDHCGMGVDD